MLVSLSLVLCLHPATGLVLADPQPSQPKPSHVARNVLSIDWLPASVRRWAPQIEAAASRHRVHPDLIALVMLIESKGEPEAQSPTGARGLMQLMPATARAIATQRGEPVPSPAELFDPQLNLDLAAFHLAQLQADLVDGPVSTPTEVGRVAAAYNGGLERALRWLGGRQPLSLETRKYRKTLMKLWDRRHDEE